jgi:hypothetical protein
MWRACARAKGIGTYQNKMPTAKRMVAAKMKENNKDTLTSSPCIRLRLKNPPAGHATCPARLAACIVQSLLYDSACPLYRALTTKPAVATGSVRHVPRTRPKRCNTRHLVATRRCMRQRCNTRGTPLPFPSTRPHEPLADTAEESVLDEAVAEQRHVEAARPQVPASTISTYGSLRESLCRTDLPTCRKAGRVRCLSAPQGPPPPAASAASASHTYW